MAIEYAVEGVGNMRQDLFLTGRSEALPRMAERKNAKQREKIKKPIGRLRICWKVSETRARAISDRTLGGSSEDGRRKKCEAKREKLKAYSAIENVLEGVKRHPEPLMRMIERKRIRSKYGYANYNRKSHTYIYERYAIRKDSIG